MTLYELTNEYLNLLRAAESEDLDPDAVRDTLESLSGDIEDKAEGYICVIKELEAEADKFDAEIKRMFVHSTRIHNNIKRMKETLMASMIATGKPKLQTDHFRISVAGNGGVQPIKFTADVPDDYKVAVLSPDNKKIREELEAGVVLDFAHLEERGKHLNIK